MIPFFYFLQRCVGGVSLLLQLARGYMYDAVALITYLPCTYCSAATFALAMFVVRCYYHIVVITVVHTVWLVIYSD